VGAFQTMSSPFLFVAGACLRRGSGRAGGCAAPGGEDRIARFSTADGWPRKFVDISALAVAVALFGDLPERVAGLTVVKTRTLMRRRPR